MPLQKATMASGAAQGHRLDDVVAALRGVGDAGEAQLLIDVGGKDSALQSAGHHRGGQEQPLVQGGHQPQVGAHLLAQARGGEPVGAPVHALLGAADVAADGGKAAAGVFDEAAHHHVGPQIRRAPGLHELAVAVVHHDFHVRLDPLAEGDQFPDLPDREGGAGGVALGPLDGDELGAAVDLLPDGVVVEGSVGLQVRLGIGDAVLLQGAFALPDADDLLQGVIGAPTGDSSSSPGSRLAERATARAWVPQVIWGRTRAASVWNTSAYTRSRLSRPSSL